MRLPTKDHFSLNELAGRWRTQVADVQYYAVRGMLEVETWLRMPVRIRRCAHSALATDYEGYVVVKPDELRRIFRGDASYLSIALEDLVVSRAERDRFEHEHGIQCSADRSSQVAVTPQPESVVSFPGRPSVMRRIVDEFEARHNRGQMERSLQKEGEALVAWAKTHIPDVQIPTARTIRNAIRDQYRHFALTSKV